MYRCGLWLLSFLRSCCSAHIACHFPTSFARIWQKSSTNFTHCTLARTHMLTQGSYYGDTHARHLQVPLIGGHVVVRDANIAHTLFGANAPIFLQHTKIDHSPWCNPSNVALYNHYTPFCDDMCQKSNTEIASAKPTASLCNKHTQYGRPIRHSHHGGRASSTSRRSKTASPKTYFYINSIKITEACWHVVYYTKYLSTIQDTRQFTCKQSLPTFQVSSSLGHGTHLAGGRQPWTRKVLGGGQEIPPPPPAVRMMP